MNPPAYSPPPFALASLSNGAIFRVSGPRRVPALGHLGLALLALGLLAAAFCGVRSRRVDL